MRYYTSLATLLSLASLTAAVSLTLEEVANGAAEGLRLLSLAPDTDPVWKTEDEKLELMRAGVQFFDVTEVYDPDAPTGSSATKLVAVTYPSPSKQDQVNPLLETVSIPSMQSYLGNLTAFNNRYYRSSTGAEASAWIVDTINEIIAAFPDSGASVAPFTHSWVEPSVIAKIPGTTDSPVTILGAHMDSINLNSPTSGRAPGADDDGSGSVNLIEAFRVLLAANFTPTTPVEFQWYAGEEAGLLGSQAIARSYKNASVDVYAMLQLDMTAYFQPGTTEVIALMPDFISEDLNTFMKSLIETYSTLPWVMSAECGYACSDHASWFNQGYPTTLPFETRFGEDNPRIHTSGDTTSVSGFSWTHTLEYAKLAVAFAYELAA